MSTSLVSPLLKVSSIYDIFVLIHVSALRPLFLTPSPANDLQNLGGRKLQYFSVAVAQHSRRFTLSRRHSMVPAFLQRGRQENLSDSE